MSVRLNEEDMLSIAEQLNGESVPTFKEVNDNVKTDMKENAKLKRKIGKEKEKADNAKQCKVKKKLPSKKTVKKEQKPKPRKKKKLTDLKKKKKKDDSSSSSESSSSCGISSSCESTSSDSESDSVSD